MSEHRRITDDGPDGLGASLLRAAREYRPPARAHRRILAAVGVGGATTLTSSKAAAIAAVLEAFAAGKAGVALLATCGAAALGAGYYVMGMSETSPVPVGLVASAPPSPAPVSPSSLPGLEPASSTALDPGAPPAPRSARAPLEPRPPAAVVSAPPEDAPDTLGEELALVDEARAAQRAGRLELALARLDERDRRFPRGRLGPQTEILRIEMLASAGRRAEAHRRAVAFVEAHPRTILTARARELAESTAVP